MPFDFTLESAKVIMSYYKTIDPKNQFILTEYVRAARRHGNLSEDNVGMLLAVLRHSCFLELLVPEFWETYSLPRFHVPVVVVLMYIVIFEVEQENVQKAVVFFNSSCKLYADYLKVPMFFEYEENIAFVAKIACNHFDKEYVFDKIIYPLLNKQPALLELIAQTESFYMKQNTNIPKATTVPQEPLCMKRAKTRSILEDIPEEAPPFEAKRVPKTMYEQNKKLDEKLKEAKERNRKKALRLLEEATVDPFKCANVKKKVSKQEIPRKAALVRAPIPPQKDVKVKLNATSLLRQAATISKGQDVEIKKIERLATGSLDIDIDAIAERIRRDQERKAMQEIEKKHLQGLLTHEEAFIARRNVYLANKEKMEIFKAERENILAQFEAFRHRERLRAQGLVEKTQNIEKAAKEAERKLLEKKQSDKKLMDEESKKLLKEAHEKYQDELSEKIRIIKELRALNRLRRINGKNFDPTISSNIGLLCEMSLTELRERLVLVRMEMKEELDERKKSVEEFNKKRETLIDTTKTYIDQTKAISAKQPRAKPPELEQTPEIVALKEKLQQTKNRRKKLIA